MNFAQLFNPVFKGIVCSILLMATSSSLNFRSLSVSAQAMAEAIREQLTFNPPDDDSLPDPGRSTSQQTPGSDRGDCPVVDLPLTALIPKPDQIRELTTQEYPTYWVYIPYGATQIHSIRFDLWQVGMNGARQRLYTTNLSPNTIPGIVSFTPTASEAALTLSTATAMQEYEWIVTINCDDPQTPGGSNKRRVQGDIVRSSLPESMSNLSESPSIEQAQIYAQNGFWYDTLTVLGNLRRQSDNEELKQLWTQLLSNEFVELESVTNQPFVD